MTVTARKAAVLLAAVTLLFHAMYWNRFVGPSSSGMFFYTAELLLDGKTPYRDFFLIVPILHPLKLAALMQIFGHKMIVLRAEAVFERTALAVLTFYWLRRFTPTLPAMLRRIRIH